MPVFPNVYYEIAAILLLAAAVAAVGNWLRQPLIIAYLVAGVLVGPAVLGWVSTNDSIDLLATLGIAILLFVVGLKLDLDLIRSVGPVALATGLGQVFFTSVVGFGIALALGLDVVTAIYVAVALTFSSTIIIVKLLSDKREIDSLHGRIAVGFLIVQDIVVVLVMIALSAVAGAGEAGEGVLRLIAYGGAFLIGIYLLTRFAIPPLLDRLARTPELLLLAAVAWAVALAALGDVLGLSKEVGAFLGGVSLASTRYREAIAGRLVSLRDFLLLFFFIDLGAKLDLTSFATQLPQATVLSAFVLIGNPLIVVAIMGAMGYRRRTGLLAGLTVAQISEFSLILTALGVTLGHITSETLGLVTAVGIMTIGISTYLILYSERLYERLEHPLRFFERSVPHKEETLEDRLSSPVRVDAIVFGLGRYGRNIASGLTAAGIRVLGVDFDPRAVRQGRERGYATRYGDSEDPELPATLPLGQAGVVVSTIPNVEANVALERALRTHGFGGRLAATAHSTADGERLAESGVDVVLLPFVDAADRAVEVLMAGGAEDESTRHRSSMVE